MAEPAPRVAFLGPASSYSHEAATTIFGPGQAWCPRGTIAEVIEDVGVGHEYGVVPIENTTDGRVVDTLARLIRGDRTIVGEHRLAIHHNLMVAPETGDVTEVRSKPQALSQCRRFLATHYPGVRQIAVASTAAAAGQAAAEPGVAAIASAAAAEAHGLRVLRRNIEDRSNNVTRFVVLGREPVAATGRDKTSLVFQVDHRPGSLADAMMVFKNHRLNLTFIESFPCPDRESEYQFFVELTGHRDDAAVSEAIDALGSITRRLVWLGSYPSDASEPIADPPPSMADGSSPER